MHELSGTGVLEWSHQVEKKNNYLSSLGTSINLGGSFPPTAFCSPGLIVLAYLCI
jgi:hypothetical protein